jgi:hypothetical protein
MSKLESKLDALIAEQDNIRPGDVTLEHIRSKRHSDLDVNYDSSTYYGGYNRRGAKLLTARQSTELIQAAYTFLDHFKRKTRSVK